LEKSKVGGARRRERGEESVGGLSGLCTGSGWVRAKGGEESGWNRVVGYAGRPGVAGGSRSEPFFSPLLGGGRLWLRDSGGNSASEERLSGGSDCRTADEDAPEGSWSTASAYLATVVLERLSMGGWGATLSALVGWAGRGVVDEGAGAEVEEGGGLD
jgi:hypothetical protein